MNLILFGKEEIGKPLLRGDSRFEHIRKILKLSEGDSFDSGIIGGPGGTATITGLSEASLTLSFREEWQPAPLYPVTMIIGLPRPPTARRLLKDLTAAGIGRIWFTGTELGEKSYLTSKIWKKGKFGEYLLEGAQQGESTLLPEVRLFHSVRGCLAELDCENRVALDNNESMGSISHYKPSEGETAVAIGSERGWTVRERDLFRETDFTLLSMGTRVLRTETACAMAAGFILAATGRI